MIIISLGCNVNGWIKFNYPTFIAAHDLLNAFNIRVLNSSRIYLTEPYGVTGQPCFINSAVLVQSSLPPFSLLAVLKQIEAIAGRRPGKKWGPRPLDLDIIDYKGLTLSAAKALTGDFMHNKRDLILPHPGIAFRPFVLQPIHDIAPFWHHPLTGLTAAQMLRRLPANSPGKIIKSFDA